MLKRKRPAETAAASASKSDLDLKVKWKGAPELSSTEGKFKMKVRGRVEVDYNKANQDTRITSFQMWQVQSLDVRGSALKESSTTTGNTLLRSTSPTMRSVSEMPILTIRV